MIQRKKNAPTIKDVAAEAGVSVGSVSKVINGKPTSDKCRRLVLDAIEKLDYRVNSYAQGLKSSRTCTVALLIPNTVNPFFAQLVYHINTALLHRNYRMLLCCTEYDPSLEQEYVSMVQQNKVDGIIGLTFNPDIQIDPEISFVSIDRVINPYTPCVTSDNYAGGVLAAAQLARLGCKSAAFLRVGSRLDTEPNKRRSGFENGCLMHGLQYETMLLDDGDHNNELFREYLTGHIHSGKLDFDGIFCVTDMLACNIRAILKDLGLSAPQDVQLIGFDGIRQFGSGDYLCSTIVQPVEDLAKMAVDLLLLRNESVRPPLVCLPVEFAEGGTTRILEGDTT